MKRFMSLTLLSAFLLAACGSLTARTATVAPVAPTTSRKLTVFAAASLTDAFKELGKAFEASHPDVTVTLNFAGSQTLRTQIEQGAQADIFASANTKEMDTLVSEGFVAQGAPQVFLSNQLVVILPAKNPAGLQGLEDLAKPGVKLVLAAEDVPAGNYARQALDLMDAKFGNGYKASVLANVVSNEEDVKQVVAKVQLGEADAGIVYMSDAIAAPELKTIEIPADLNVIAEYPISVVAKTPNPDLTAPFIAFVLSPDGQAILQKWGFAPAQ
jgi:molybdate transport system substrate-binding protein